MWWRGGGADRVAAAADAQTGRILAIDAVGHLHSVDCAGDDYDIVAKMLRLNEG
jgi:hypothetical protein